MAVGFPHLKSGASPPEYAIDAQKVNIIKIDLSTARERVRVHIGGSLLWVVDASDNFAELEFVFREDQTDGIPLRLGSKISGVKFSRTEITNAAQLGAWVKILYAADKGEFIGIENPYALEEETAALSGNYYTGVSVASGGAANSHCQLWNPADSGVNVFVLSASESHGGGLDVIKVQITQVECANAMPDGNLWNNFVSQPVGKAIVKWEAKAVVSDIDLTRIQLINGRLVNLPLGRIILPPGYGLQIANNTVGRSEYVNYTWHERTL